MLKAEGKSKWVYINYIVYLVAIIGTTLYAYGRLEFVRKKEIQQEKAIENL
jgi:hypothetical protein